MISKSTLLTAILFIQFTVASAQSQYFNLYMYDIKLINSAFTGIEESQSFSAFYKRIGSENISDIRSMLLSYENQLQTINSGVGAMAYYNEAGNFTEAGTGLLYNYQIKINGSNKINIGTALHLQKFAIDRDAYRALNTNDPVILTGKSSTTNFDVDLGAAYKRKELLIGVSFANLLEPEFEGFLRKEKSVINLSLSNRFILTEWLVFKPSVFYSSGQYSHQVDINPVFKVYDLFLLGAGYLVRENRDNNINFNGGIDIKNTVQLVVHAYSSVYQKYRDNYGSRFEAMVRVSLG